MLGKRSRETDSGGGGSEERTEKVEETSPGSTKKMKLEEESVARPEEKPQSVVRPEEKPSGSSTAAVPEKSSVKDAKVEDRGKMELLVSAFSSTQQDQYEIFRRSTFPKSTIRKLMQSVCGSTVPQNAVIAMAGIAKVYVGEIVEEACQARETGNEEGPLQPKHIREAVRRLRKRDKVPNSRYKKVFPFR